MGLFKTMLNIIKIVLVCLIVLFTAITVTFSIIGYPTITPLVFYTATSIAVFCIVVYMIVSMSESTDE